MGFLLDTNVLSELRKEHECHPAVAAWMAGVAAEDLFISVIAIGELWRGVEQVQRRDPPSAWHLARWVRHIEHVHRARILPVTTAIARRWGRFSVEQLLPAEDALMAATALENGLVVATRNVRDFNRSGVVLVNPWDYQA